MALRAGYFLHGQRELGPNVSEIAWFDERGEPIPDKSWEKSRAAAFVAAARCGRRKRNDFHLDLAAQSDPAGSLIPGCRNQILPARILLDIAKPEQNQIDLKDPNVAVHAHCAVLTFSQLGACQIMSSHNWHLPFGANLLEKNRTSFRIWAPAQKALSLAIEDMPTMPMSRCGDGWFETEVNCGAGSRYCYVLQDGTAIPDPAARAQAADVLLVQASSLIPHPIIGFTPNGAAARGRKRCCTNFTPVCSADLTGSAENWPGSPQLGITAVELMPIAEFPGERNWGYDGVLPFAPEHSYGTPDQLKALIDAAHGHGLMMFLDVVYNHFGPDGNYLPVLAPQMFRSDVPTPWGPAIDFRQSAVRRFFIENALYWLLEYRFDGLRFDAVHAISDPEFLDEMAAEVRRTVGRGRQIHLVLENDDNVASHLARDFDAQWNDDGHHVLHALLTGEREGYYQDYADAPAARLARSLKDGFVYQGEPSRMGRSTTGTNSADLPPTAFVLFLQNHDQIGNRAFGDRLTGACQTGGAGGSDCAPAPLSANTVAVYGRRTRQRLAVPVLYRSHPGSRKGCAERGEAARISGFPEFSDPAQLAKLPILTR